MKPKTQNDYFVRPIRALHYSNLEKLSSIGKPKEIEILYRKEHSDENPY